MKPDHRTELDGRACDTHLMCDENGCLATATRGFRTWVLATRANGSVGRLRHAESVRLCRTHALERAAVGVLLRGGLDYPWSTLALAAHWPEAETAFRLPDEVLDTLSPSRRDLVEVLHRSGDLMSSNQLVAETRRTKPFVAKAVKGLVALGLVQVVSRATGHAYRIADRTETER